MCDTVAIVSAGRVLFAKNSDREPNEAQVLEWHPAQDHREGAMLRCTHIDIPQAAHTHAILISRPFWMWGAEMGTNEHGVAIGNEAVFTNQPCAKSGLTGMDLLRLALERAASARQGVDVITELLGRHGQGGGCGLHHRAFTYHNSFIVADPREAFVLETAGRHWAVEEVRGVRSISNGLTIPAFRDKYASRLHEAVAACRLRQARTAQLAAKSRDAAGLMAALRDYAGAEAPRYRLLNGGMGAPCMHAGGVVANAQTVASWVSELSADGNRHWVTATSIPFLSIFKEVDVHTPVDLGPLPGGTADRASLWWKHERVVRPLVAAWGEDTLAFAGQCLELETHWLRAGLRGQECFTQHHALLDTWSQQPTARCDSRPWWVRRYWSRQDALAGL
jgi:secernin